MATTANRRKLAQLVHDALVMAAHAIQLPADASYVPATLRAGAVNVARTVIGVNR